MKTPVITISQHGHLGWLQRFIQLFRPNWDNASAICGAFLTCHRMEQNQLHPKDKNLCIPITTAEAKLSSASLCEHTRTRAPARSVCEPCSQLPNHVSHKHSNFYITPIFSWIQCIYLLSVVCHCSLHPRTRAPARSEPSRALAAGMRPIGMQGDVTSPSYISCLPALCYYCMLLQSGSQLSMSSFASNSRLYHCNPNSILKAHSRRREIVGGDSYRLNWSTATRVLIWHTILERKRHWSIITKTPIKM